MEYIFRCVDHPDRTQVVFCSWRERDNIIPDRCEICGQPFDQELRGSGGGWFKIVYGKLTGCYDYDYGKKATWDLTAPGKLDYCKKEGIIKDPFDHGPRPVTNDHLVPEI